MQQVTVSASALDQRAQSTTTAIVVGRDEIVRQGDAIADRCAQAPARHHHRRRTRQAGDPHARAGCGYVAILLNGLPAPGGFSLESIDPELVERIEILRAPTAETSGQAVAGAINIILRKAGKTVRHRPKSRPVAASRPAAHPQA
jgi:hypothetical protein